MTIKEQIKAEMIQAMRDGDKTILSTTKLILSEFDRNSKEIDDDQALKILGKLAKSEKEMMAITKTTESDLLTMINRYVPSAPTDKEITQWIQDNVDFSKLGNHMQAIGMVKKHFGARVANLGKEISLIVESFSD